MDVAQLHNYAAVPDLTPQILVSLVSLGMALAFISADRKSGISRMLALSFAFMGIAIDLNVVVSLQWSVPAAWTGWFAIPEMLAIVTLMEWILRVRRTVPAGTLDTRAGDGVLRIGQAAGVTYAALAIAFPELRHAVFLGSLTSAGAAHEPGFWLFAAPILLAGSSGMFSMLLLLNRRPDRAETLRVLAMAAAIPFFASSFVLQLKYSAVAMVVGQMIFLCGAVRYHVLQGQRGQFMSRFLSPQVAQLVSERGLQGAMQENDLDITVVSCDLRGFTAYAQAQPSATVLRMLRAYYDAAGSVAAEFGATIKDFAGDGVLILVGAPLPNAQHATQGVALAHGLRSAVAKVIANEPLGIGVGVASGRVTVGVIGSSGRFEYTAVGPAVNLASRLCELAADGEVLVAAETMQACGPGTHQLAERAPVMVKGYAAPVAHFNLQPASTLAT